MRRKTRLQPVTELEQLVLTNLWEIGELTIRQLTDAIYENGTDSEYATIQKILDRLELKQYVTRDRSAQAHKFRAIVDKKTFLSSKLQAMADSLCDGSLTPLVSCLVESTRFSKADLDSLREIVDGLEKRSRGSKTGPGKKAGR